MELPQSPATLHCPLSQNWQNAEKIFSPNTEKKMLIQFIKQEHTIRHQGYQNVPIFSDSNIKEKFGLNLKENNVTHYI